MATIPASVRPALEAYRDVLRRRLGARLVDVRLFGSYARGDASFASDVDVLVVVDGLTDRELGEAAGDVAEVILATNVDLSPLILSSERLAAMRAAERALVRALDEEGISL